MNVSTLSSLYEYEGPFVSIYLDTESAVPDAASRLELRWKDVVRDLHDAGVDEATVGALTEHRGGHELGGTRVLVASAGTVHLAMSLPETTDTDVVRVAELPYLLPLVDWAQTRIPHVVVLVDRKGADLLAYTDGGDPAESTSVNSGRNPVHKTGGGDLGVQHHQLKVEENWKANAKDVAASVDRVSQDIDAQLIVIAGDEHAVELLREHLPQPLAERVAVVEGGRAEDGSDVHVAKHVLEALAARLRDDVVDVMEQFAKFRNRAEKMAETHPATDVAGVAVNAADGVEATLAALRKAQVGTLLIAEDLDEDATVFYGPAPTLLATKESELHDMGVEQPQTGPLIDVLLRAALGTAADIRLVPSSTPDSPEGGVGALLRYSDTSAEAASS